MVCEIRVEIKTEEDSRGTGETRIARPCERRRRCPLQEVHTQGIPNVLRRAMTRPWGKPNGLPPAQENTTNRGESMERNGLLEEAADP